MIHYGCSGSVISLLEMEQLEQQTATEVMQSNDVLVFSLEQSCLCCVITWSLQTMVWFLPSENILHLPEGSCPLP